MQFELFGAQFFSLKEQSNVRIYKVATTSLILTFLFGSTIVFDTFRRSNNNSLTLAHTNLVPLKEPEPAPVIPTTEVLVPNSDIEAGTTLNKQMFELKSLVSEFIPPDALRSNELVDGKISVRKLSVGTLTLSRDLASSHENFGFDLPIGSRAVTVQLNSQSSVEGYAKPGSIVDVSFVFTNDKGTQSITTLVHNAKVASVNGSTSPAEFLPSKGHFPVTLVVSERDAKAIRLASESGSISLALVGTPELIVPDPRTETFSLAMLAAPPTEDKEERFSPTAHIERTTDEDSSSEKVLITNRRTSSVK